MLKYWLLDKSPELTNERFPESVFLYLLNLSLDRFLVQTTAIGILRSGLFHVQFCQSRSVCVHHLNCKSLKRNILRWRRDIKWGWVLQSQVQMGRRRRVVREVWAEFISHRKEVVGGLLAFINQESVVWIHAMDLQGGNGTEFTSLLLHKHRILGVHWPRVCCWFSLSCKLHCSFWRVSGVVKIA